ncbi:MAG TPA: hypothetical protein VGE40_01285 [Bacilli bacterium]
MNIQVMTANLEILASLERCGYFEQVEKVTEIKQLSSDLILMTEDSIGCHELFDLRLYHEHAVIFYMVSKENDFTSLKKIHMILEATHIHLIMGHYSPAEVIERMFQHFIVENKIDYNPVIVFQGTHSGAGVTSTLQSLAKILSEMTDHKIGVLGFNAWDAGTQFMNYSSEFMDQLKIRMTNHLLTSEELIAAMAHKGFYYLAGNRKSKLERFYTEDEVQFLIELSRQTFDVVLIDAGCHVDNAMSLQALKSADIRYLVTTQQQKGLDRWKRMHTEIKLCHDYLIVNKYRKLPELFTSKIISDELRTTFLASIPHLESYGDIAEVTRKNLIDFHFNEYSEVIKMIANGLISKLQLTLKPEFLDVAKKRKLSWLKGGKRNELSIGN